MRDKIRAATIGQSQSFRSEIVKVNDVEIEVRQLTIKERSDVVKTFTDQKGDKDPLKMQIHEIIASCYVPNTNEKVFEDTDFEAMVSCYAGSYLDALYSSILELQTYSIEDAKKN